MIPDWKGKTAVAIASGASLTQEDIDYCKDKARVCVVNDNYRLAPWADLLYACDLQWWDYHKPDFAGQKWTVDDEAAQKYNLNHITGHSRSGLSLDRSFIHFGRNSGFQLLNLLAHAGVSRILLLGYDFQETAGKKHWFGSHPFPLHNMNDWRNSLRAINDASKDFNTLGIEVVNCSRNSAITAYRRSTVQEEL